MYQRGIRGAITVDSNTEESLKSAVIELINEIKQQNNFKTEEEFSQRKFYGLEICSYGMFSRVKHTKFAFNVS